MLKKYQKKKKITKLNDELSKYSLPIFFATKPMVKLSNIFFDIPKSSVTPYIDSVNNFDRLNLNL